MTKPASAFAPAVGGGGKTIAWEALSVFFAPQNLPTSFPTVAAVVAGQTLRFVSLIPENVTRGTVTLERIRGSIYTHWASSIIDSGGQRIHLPVPYTIQLVPVQNGVVALDSVLDGRNAADLESNRIIWRGVIYPDLNTADGSAIDGIRVYSHVIELDIKSRRRFDRATWALVFAVSFDTVQEVLVFTGSDMRALFRTADGI